MSFSDKTNESICCQSTSRSDMALLCRIATFYNPHRKQMILTLAVVVVAVVLGIMPPLFLQAIIDQGIKQNDLYLTTYYSVLGILATLGCSLATILYFYLSVQLGLQISAELRFQLFSHLTRMSMRFFTSTRIGDIQTRLISDNDNVINVLSNTIVETFSNFMVLLSCTVVMFYLDYRLALLTYAFIPIIAYLSKARSTFIRESHKIIQTQTGNINSMIQENLSVSGSLLFKTVGKNEVLREQFSLQNQKLNNFYLLWSLRNSFYCNGIYPLISTVIPIIVYWYAAWLMKIADKHLTIGLLVAYSALQINMLGQVTSLVTTYNEIVKSFASFERIFEYLDITPEIVDRPYAVDVSRQSLEGQVSFNHVWFKYEDQTTEWTLSEINFTAEPGQLIALVGPTGAGKTTITHLISRLYDVQIGSVKIDGIDVRDISLKSLEQVVSVVSQESYFLNTTIANNLRLADPHATDEQIIQICRVASIHDHIVSLPDGYNTLVGERGHKLSGGEKQRLSIARALLKNSRILILDEATSALDTESEKLIQASLARLMKGRTTFAIAHRLSTIEKADMIVVIDNGRIIESGTHEELIRAGEMYALLNRHQNVSTHVNIPNPT